MSRPKKTKYYLDIALSVAKRSSCLRRNYGAVIVKNDEIISTGFNGTPRGMFNCCDLGYCSKNAHNIPHGVGYEDYCNSAHAEMNAIIHASRTEMLGSTLYLSGIDYETGQLILNAEPCSICFRMIVNAGIDLVVTLKKTGDGEFHDLYNGLVVKDIVNEMRREKIKERL